MTLTEVKKNMEKTVLYDGDPYRLTACRMFIDPITKRFAYGGELVSMRTNTVIHAPLDKIKEK